MGLRFYTFKSDYDLEKLNSTELISTDKNLNENFLFEAISSYTGENGIVYFWACFDELNLNGYLGYRYLIEFKEPKDYILLTPDRFDYLNKGVLEKYDNDMPNIPTPLEGYKWLMNNTNLREYIDDFKPSIDEKNAFNPSGNLPVSNVYMGIMTKLRKEDIISIKDLNE